MANSFFLSQYRVDSNSGLSRDSPEPEEKYISESEFTTLLKQQWPATKAPQKFLEHNWLYTQIKKTETEIGFGELSLLDGKMICERHLGNNEWILVALIFRDFVQKPVYMWNDSNLDDFLEIIDATTADDILLWLDSR